MRRTGVSANHLRDVDELRFEWSRGLVFIRWAIVEDIPGAAVAREPQPGRTNKERVIVSGLAWSVEQAREKAECWLGIHWLKPPPPRSSAPNNELIRDMLPKP